MSWTVLVQCWKRFRRPASRGATVGLAAILAASLIGLGAGSAADLPAGPLPLSLEEALERGLASSSAVRLAELDLERASVTLDQARSAAKSVPDSAATTLDLGKVKELVPRKAEMGERLAEKGLAAARDNAALGVRQAYFAAVLARDVRQVRQLAVNLTKQQLAIATAGVRSGSRARTDVLAAESQLATATADLSTANKDYQVALMNLNKALGLPLTTELSLTTHLADRPPASVDIEAAIAAAGEASVSLLKASEEVAVADLDRSLVERYTAKNTYDYLLADAALQQAEIRLTGQRTDTELAARKGWLEIADAYERIAQHRKAVAAAEEGLRLANLRYSAGLGTSTEALDAQVRASGARSALASALFGYEMALAQFDVLTGKTAAGADGTAGAGATGGAQ